MSVDDLKIVDLARHQSTQLENMLSSISGMQNKLENQDKLITLLSNRNAELLSNVDNSRDSAHDKVVSDSEIDRTIQD